MALSRPNPRSSATSIEEETYTIEQLFVMYSKLGDVKSDGTRIALSQSDKWMKQAKLIDGRKLTTTMTGVAFNKFKRRTISYKQYLVFLHELAEIKKIEFEELLDILIDAGPPGTGKPEKQAPKGSQMKLPEDEIKTETQ